MAYAQAARLLQAERVAERVAIEIGNGEPVRLDGGDDGDGDGGCSGDRCGSCC